MLVWLAVKNLAEKCQYPKSRNFTFLGQLFLELAISVEMVWLKTNHIEIYTKMNALLQFMLDLFLAFK
jgi:hypothetical protein